MGDDPNQRGNSRRWIRRAVEDSLRRLNTDHIDLYQMHRPSDDTDVAETLSALTDLVHEGKVLYLGASTVPASRIVEAQHVARDRGLQRFVTEQPAYSMLTRYIENDVLPTTLRYGMGVLTYSPIGAGWLSGKWRKGVADLAPTSPVRQRITARFDLSLPENQRKLDAADAFAQLAEEHDLSLVELAVAFVLNHPAVTSAIVGPRTMEQLETQLPAADVTLNSELLDRIDQINAPGVAINPADTGYPSPATRRR